VSAGTKSAKNTDDLTVFFALLGSGPVKLLVEQEGATYGPRATSGPRRLIF